MTDITTTYLEAAIIDQKVAGEFQGKRYAFLSIAAKGGWGLAVAVYGEPGYSPIAGKLFDERREAAEWAIGLNKHIGLTTDEAMNITISTMRRNVS